MKPKLKIVVLAVLVLGFITSLGFNVYYYLAMADKQALVNNMRGEKIVAWAREMSIAGYYLKDATTNIDMHGVLSLFRSTPDIYGAGWELELCWRMDMAASDVAEKLGSYAVGAPTTVQHINPTAIEMFGNLTERIWNVTHLILKEDIKLTQKDGVDPIQLLQEKGIYDDIIDGCIDISNYSRQIRDFSPKFQ